MGGAIGGILDQLRGASPAAVVVFTDGVNTEGPTLADAAQDARRRGVPLFFVGLGSDRPAAEVKLSNLLADDVAMVDDLVTFECAVTARGLEGRKLAVVLPGKTSQPCWPERRSRPSPTAGRNRCGCRGGRANRAGSSTSSPPSRRKGQPPLRPESAWRRHRGAKGKDLRALGRGHAEFRVSVLEQRAAAGEDDRA